MNIKKNDTVVVLSGKDKGKKGKVLEAMPATGKVVVEGINVATCHVKPKKQHHEDGHHPGSLGNSVHSKLLFVKAHGEAGILPGVCRLDEGQQAPGPDHAGAAVGEERESNPRKGQNRAQS